MADETKGEKKSGAFNQILITVVGTLLVGGSAPWWTKAFTSKPDATPAPITETQPAQAQTVPAAQVQLPAKADPVVPVEDTTVSRDFFIGRWRVDHSEGMASESNNIDYMSDGRFDGTMLAVNGYLGGKVHLSGNWSVVKISDKMFELDLRNDNGTFWTGKFKILDHNHVENVDQNYVSERVE